MPSEKIYKYMRIDHLPHIWCAGCGNGTLTRDVVMAIDALCSDPEHHLSREKVVIVSGIGCSSRAAGYMDFDTLHTTHGRALAFATGVKIANPELTVIVVTGDGDCAAIGGNHLIHACRRNIDLTVVVFNNNIYGMTGGQYSPTTPQGEYGTTAPFGVVDRPFDIAALAEGAGASFTARGDTYHAKETTELIRQGIDHKGFSLIDCRSVCPTYYGRKNKKGDAVKMLTWQRDNGLPIEQFNALTPEGRQGKYGYGVLTRHDYPEYIEEYRKIVERVRKDK